MAKGQKRSNKELKKPKQKKAAAPVAGSVYGDRKPAGAPAPGKKKG